MTSYYKATRPDGTDFRTGTVRYAVGETTTHPTSKRRMVGDPSTYLSVSTAPTDCTGMAWPCRLFRVEGIGRAGLADERRPNKRTFLSVRVVEELPAWQALGPQGEQVAALIDRAGRLTADEMERLCAEWRAACRAAARGVARAAARDAACAARDAARRAARGGAAGTAAWIAAWDTARRAACRAAARGAAYSAAARGAAYSAAAYSAVGDAAIALVTKDLISADQFDTLYGPWASAVGDGTAERPRP